MALSKERIGEIAVQLLLYKLKKEGLRIHPKEIKREVLDGGKTLGIPQKELAAFFKIGLEALFKATCDELDLIIDASE